MTEHSGEHGGALGYECIPCGYHVDNACVESHNRWYVNKYRDAGLSVLEQQLKYCPVCKSYTDLTVQLHNPV